MSCDSHRQYFEASDIAMIERVLACANLRQTSNNLTLSSGPAKFLIRKFQEGMIDEDDLSAALDRYLMILKAWRSMPHYNDGRSGDENPVMVISDLLGAVDELGRLTDFERAKLLLRAAACIGYCQRQLNWPKSRTVDLEGCDIAFELAAMASAIDLFNAAETVKVIRRAVAIIGALLDEVYPAPEEIAVVAPLTIGSVCRALRNWTRRIARTQPRFGGGETARL